MKGANAIATTAATTVPADWLGAESKIARYVEDFSRRTIEAYEKQPNLVREHANLERAMVDGRYGRQQLLELVQNAADELIGIGGRVEVVLTEDALHCANEGNPFTVDGAKAVLTSYSSNKTGVEIGRFGLGFKSVLGITDQPEVFSRSGSFGFDVAKARRSIQRVLPKETDTPALRIGTALDPRRAAATDPTLATLMQWATTVVRLRRNKGGEWIAEDFEKFPAEFLIFSPHVKTLVLDNQMTAERREYGVDRDGDAVTLRRRGEADARWHVFSARHRPSAAAKADGGYAANRVEVPLHWAISKPGLGRLWAFFPTKERVTVSGIFNAPWKLTDDRSAIIKGRFNDELLEEAAGLFLGSVGKVVDPTDPGELFEMFPGRTKEKRGDADDALIKRIYAHSPGYDVIPDQGGVPQMAAKMVLHPGDLPKAALVAWSESLTRPQNWCHVSVETKGDGVTRRAKAVRLMSAGSGRTATFKEWMLALRDDERPVESSQRMLFVAEHVARGENRQQKSELATLEIVLSADGTFVPLSPGAVFLPAADGTKADVTLVHPELVEIEFVVALLKTLGVTEVSAESLLDVQIQQAACASPGSDWSAIWERSRACSRDLLPALLRKHGIPEAHASVRKRNGGWARVGGVLLVGRVLRELEMEDADHNVAIDQDWHAKDLDVLRQLGLTEGPVERKGSTDEPWGRRYLTAALQAYRRRCVGTKPADHALEIDNLGRFAGPATPLVQLSPKPAARFLAAAFAETRQLKAVEVRHRTRANMPIVRFPHPLVWLLQESKVVLSSLGPMPLDMAVGPALGRLRQILPVVDLPSDVVAQLEVPESIEELDEARWSIAHRMMLRLEDPDALLTIYAEIVDASPVPEKILAIEGGAVTERAPHSVALAATEREIRLLRDSRKPFLPCKDEQLAERLVQKWCLCRAHDLIGSELTAVRIGDAESLSDLFPLLAGIVPGPKANVQVQRCSELRRDWFTDSGRVSEALAYEFAEDTIFVADADGDRELLQLLNEQLALGLEEPDLDEVINNAFDQAVAALMAKMRAADSDPQRLLLAVDAEMLRQRLPHELISAFTDMNGEPDDIAIAELTLAALGLEALSKLAPFLREKGLQPPSSWAGSRRAIQFVRDLGFDRGYAGFKSEDRNEVLEVEGPIELPELHDYQRAAADAILELLIGADGLRGLLSLPTGAGKTRVSVQALVEAMTAEDGLASPILWIAQTDELCEQAVQSWAEVWRAVGPARPLRISRLWASNKAAPVDEGDQVVVATIDKLSSVRSKEVYDWLSEATCVVIDEAHASTGKSYTAVLKWLGMGGGRERVPLIGLSATPWRNADEDANVQLAARYGNRRLDYGAFDGEHPTTERLQGLGILAKVDHQVLEGASVPMTDDELKKLEDFGRLPPSVLAKLGEDVERNRTLLQSLLAQPAEWPILVFASSVAHAQTMAALLTNEGRSAASVSGETNPSVRRYLVDRFKRGDIKVLTNYGVLTQGFDAPAIRALYIARPTYAPNRYQQMVGRGLRGPLNGGKERCLIVNVADNLERFQAELAFHDFDYLWGA